MYANQADSRKDLRSLVRTLRLRVDPSTSTLGEYERLGTRRGRVVSQEELAEAIGVSRGWYASFERGEPINPSISMLARVANALDATPDERWTLFKLAIPELQSL